MGDYTGVDMVLTAKLMIRYKHVVRCHLSLKYMVVKLNATSITNEVGSLADILMVENFNLLGVNKGAEAELALS